MVSETPRRAGTETPSRSYERVTSSTETTALTRRDRRAPSRQLLAGRDLVGAGHHHPLSRVDARRDLHEVLALHADGDLAQHGPAVAHEPHGLALVAGEDGRGRYG